MSSNLPAQFDSGAAPQPSSQELREIRAGFLSNVEFSHLRGIPRRKRNRKQLEGSVQSRAQQFNTAHHTKPQYGDLQDQKLMIGYNTIPSSIPMSPSPGSDRAPSTNSVVTQRTLAGNSLLCTSNGVIDVDQWRTSQAPSLLSSSQEHGNIPPTHITGGSSFGPPDTRKRSMQSTVATNLQQGTRSAPIIIHRDNTTSNVRSTTTSVSTATKQHERTNQSRHWYGFWLLSLVSRILTCIVGYGQRLLGISTDTASNINHTDLALSQLTPRTESQPKEAKSTTQRTRKDQAFRDNGTENYIIPGSAYRRDFRDIEDRQASNMASCPPMRNVRTLKDIEKQEPGEWDESNTEEIGYGGTRKTGQVGSRHPLKNVRTIWD
jgi:hypothetical protein